jgi:hypothetical protein
MRDDVYPSDEYESDCAAMSSARLTAPRDVLLDSAMSTEDKRALLASWASDLRAVENWPALRRLDDGTELHIDDIIEALKTLDTPPGQQLQQAAVLPFPNHRLRRQLNHNESDDDDPPPAVMAMGLPVTCQEMDAMPSSYLANQWRPSAVVGK